MDLVSKYRDYLRYEKNFSSQTEISYCTDLAEFCLFLKNKNLEQDLISVDSSVVRVWIMELIDKGLKATSVNRKLSALKSFYKYLSKLGYIKISPLKKISGPKNRKSIPSFVNYADFESILEDQDIETTGKLSLFEEVRNKTILELFYITGMRRAELIALKDVDVDFDRKVIVVLGKRNKERLIPISEDTEKMLSSYFEIRNREVTKQKDRVFVRESGGVLYPMLVHRIVTSYLSMIPTLKKASPHVLRHSFATGMLNNSASLSAVKEILGHASLSSTEIYTHTSFEELKKIYNQAHPRA